MLFNLQNRKSRLIISLLILLIFILLVVLIVVKINCNKCNKYNITYSDNKFIQQLESLTPDALRCPKLEKGGVVRVYISGGMFDIAATLFAVGPDGMKPGLDYQSINLVDMICNFSTNQWKELQTLCNLWDVPWYGVCGEIKKMGWECYCPVRDGLTMATIMTGIANATYQDIIHPYDASSAGVRPFSQSLFQPAAMKTALHQRGYANPTQDQMISYAKELMNTACGINIGANDLYNMYSTCNACLMNYNGIQADDGAVAEVGQLGARGVPTVIMKGSVTSDFGGASNPMPLMATSSKSTLIPNLTMNSNTVFSWTKNGALPFLKGKVDRFIEANTSGLSVNDPLTNGNYNHDVPLPPLQIFWSDLGSRCYFFKTSKQIYRNSSKW